MLVYAWACTDVGRKRVKNQDCYLLAPEMKLFAVADGMGGHRGGEVASRIAVETLEAHVRAHRGRLGGVPADDAAETANPIAVLLAQGVQRANERIHGVARQEPGLLGMGTTATSVIFQGRHAFLAHVGDSRAYLLRGDRILQLSEDHSVVFQQVKAGLLTPEQARHSPFRHMISRSVGVEAAVDVDVISLEVQSGDTFVLCSDGLSGVVEDEEIGRIVGESFVHRAPEILVDLANERGGPDNVTVVVLYVVDEREVHGASDAAAAL